MDVSFISEREDLLKAIVEASPASRAVSGACAEFAASAGGLRDGNA
jgi:hypothetical protein